MEEGLKSQSEIPHVHNPPSLEWFSNSEAILKRWVSSVVAPKLGCLQRMGGIQTFRLLRRILFFEEMKLQYWCRKERIVWIWKVFFTQACPLSLKSSLLCHTLLSSFSISLKSLTWRICILFLFSPSFSFCVLICHFFTHWPAYANLHPYSCC